jgi:phosphodiesterase/alkaline phosphatase D-like protein
MSQSMPSSRRRFLQASAATVAGVVLPGWTVAKGAPAIITSDAERPQALQGLQLGDPSNGSVIVWSRSDRPARMLVDWSYDEQFNEATRIVGLMRSRRVTSRHDWILTVWNRAARCSCVFRFRAWTTIARLASR